MNTEQRIAALEAEIAALKGQAARVVPSPPQRPDEGGVRITILSEPSAFVRPTAKELPALLAAVVAKYPRLGQPKTLLGRHDELEADEYAAGFEWAFERLGFIGRATAPNTKHYVNHWVEEAKDWLRLHRPAHRGNIGGGFLAAVVAHGDIPFVVGDEQRGVVWAIGVTTYGGRQASDAWRHVLDGKLMAPVAPERRFAQPSPSQVFVGR